MPVAQQKKVMAVIDDDDLLREELVKHFQGRYTVSQGSGDTGTLRELRALQPEVVLLDLDIDGARRVRAAARRHLRRRTAGVPRGGAELSR